MSFLCHFQILLAISELQLTLPYVLYVLDVKSAVALKWHIWFENGMKMTPIFTNIFNVYYKIRWLTCYILWFLQLELKQNTLEQLKCQLGSRNVQKQVRNEHFIWVFLVRPSFNFITWHVHEWRTQSVNCSIFLSTQILF